MPVSLEYRTILIHVPKTAGTSIEKVLGVYGRRDCLHGLSKGSSMQHWTAGEVIDLMGIELYRNFFSIGFVRNPWDRLVSEYAFLKKGDISIESDLTFHQFLSKLPVKKGVDAEPLYQHLRPQSEYLYDNDGNMLVDYVGRFENLNACWNDISNKIFQHSGMRPETELPRTQTSHHEHYSRYYNHESREWVARIYEKDIKIHHYQFEQR